MRKHRDYETTCRCGAYTFPHRFGGGRCTGMGVVARARSASCCGFAQPCITCVENDDLSCAVIDGRESPEQCDAWQEFVADNEIRIYKVNWRKS